jgi:hypothetical protein
MPVLSAAMKFPLNYRQIRYFLARTETAEILSAWQTINARERCVKSLPAKNSESWSDGVRDNSWVQAVQIVQDDFGSVYRRI